MRLGARSVRIFLGRLVRPSRKRGFFFGVISDGQKKLVPGIAGWAHSRVLYRCRKYVLRAEDSLSLYFRAISRD
jgi:hypothetical protein